MNPSSISAINQLPQRRKRGTRIRTAENVSAIPRVRVKGKARLECTLNSVSACAHWNGSESFHAPDVKKMMARRRAATLPSVFCQAGRSTPPGTRPSSACSTALLLILSLFYPSCRPPAEELLSGFCSLAYIFFGVRPRQESGFELRRRKINTPIQHEMEEFLETCGIQPLSRVPVSNGPRSEKKREQRPYAVH